MITRHSIAALILMGSLAACGNGNSGSRDGGMSAAESGSQLLGGAAMPGAVEGGAVGAAAGTTTNDQMELGKPVWR